MTVLAFDVNETLLDLRALDAPFAATFGDAALRPQWFALMLQIAFAGGLTGSYVDFTTAQRSARAQARTAAVPDGRRTMRRLYRRRTPRRGARLGHRGRPRGGVPRGLRRAAGCDALRPWAAA